VTFNAGFFVPPIPFSRVQTLVPGDRVALVAPSGPVSEDDVARAIDNVASLGCEPVPGVHLRERYSYFAARDPDRLHDLNAALRDDSVAAIWCVRGGHGTTHLLHALDYDAMRDRPRALIGYSDITALHAAFGRMAGVTTFHGPTAREVWSPFARASLLRALRDGRDSCGHAPGARTIRGGVAQGRLAGGNLSLLAALTGTRFFPDLRGAILVLEDVNEGLYRVDRMLWHLRMTGALDDLAGIAFGQCTGCDGDESPDDARLERTLDDVLREIADPLGVPCLAGIPVGHVAEQWTIPLGAIATLDADAHTLTVGER